MARLPYVAPGTSPEVDSLYAEISGMGRILANLYTVLANRPPALSAFLGMSRYVWSASSLEPGLRELAILATAHELGQRYELAHHKEAAAAGDCRLVSPVRGGSRAAHVELEPIFEGRV